MQTASRPATARNISAFDSSPEASTTPVTHRPRPRPEMNGHGALADGQKRTFAVKVGLAQMLKGGVIMDVTTAEEVRTMAEKQGLATRAGAEGGAKQGNGRDHEARYTGGAGSNAPRRPAPKRPPPRPALAPHCDAHVCPPSHAERGPASCGA